MPAFEMAKYSDLTVIIPTLNEKGNISAIVKDLTERYFGVHIIIADDGSTDGTLEEARLVTEKSGGKVVLLNRSKSHAHGLTISVIEAALRTRTKKIIVMDADMQHPISKVRNIYEALDSNDLAIGIRTSVREWGLHRRILSRGINLISYTVFKLRGKPTCSDMMSGFFGIRTPLFQKVIKESRDEYVNEGYKVLLDTLRLLDRSVRIKEIGYSTFRDRKRGKSKLRVTHMLRVLNSTFR